MQSVLAGLSLLIVGDSHWAGQNALVATMHDQLIRRGARVASFGACGSPASVWVAARAPVCGLASRIQGGPISMRTGASAVTTPLEELVRRHQPSMIVVSIADTMGGYGQRRMPRDWIREEVTALTARLRAVGLPCVWIGPSWGTEGGPYLKTFDQVRELSEYLATLVSPCTYLDSTKLSRPGEWPTFDGQHYTVPGYRAYGAALATHFAQMPEVRAVVQQSQATGNRPRTVSGRS